MNKRQLQRQLSILFFTIGQMALLVGCATPNPHPFQDFAAAVKSASDGIDHVLAQDIDWSREKYIAGVLDGSVNLPHTALLDHVRPFTVVYPTNNVTNEPTFCKLQTARVTLLAINNATTEYVTLLEQLAGNALVDTNTFAAMAIETDASLNAANQLLNAHVSADEVHIFSVASTEITRLVIERRREKALETILTQNQAGIEGYSRQCLRLLAILDQSLATDYDNSALALCDQFVEIPQDKRVSDPIARKCVEELLQLNADYLALVQVLNTTKRVYEALPQGHLALLKSIENKPTDLQVIENIYEEGKRLNGIYNELSKPAATSDKKG